jgi:predicted dehydrogenase
MGANHAKAAQQLPSVVTLAGVADLLPDRRAPFADTPIVGVDYHELLARDEIEAVVVALPNYMHAEACFAAFQAGKHVLCEKPLGRTAAEAKQITDAAHRAGLTLMVGFNQRFCAEFTWLSRQIGVYPPGRIYFARCGWLRRTRVDRRNRPWHMDKSKSGRGPLIDLGVHVIDLTLSLLGFPQPVEVMAQVEQPYSEGDCEDFTSALVRFDNGTVLQVQVQEEGHVAAEDVFVEFQGIQCGGKYHPGEQPRLFVGRTEMQGDIVAPATLVSEPFISRQIGLLNRFAEIVAGDAPPTCTGEESQIGLKVVEAIYESGAEGRAIRLDGR